MHTIKLEKYHEAVRSQREFFLSLRARRSEIPAQFSLSVTGYWKTVFANNVLSNGIHASASNWSAKTGLCASTATNFSNERVSSLNSLKKKVKHARAQKASHRGCKSICYYLKNTRKFQKLILSLRSTSNGVQECINSPHADNNIAGAERAASKYDI